MERGRRRRGAARCTHLVGGLGAPCRAAREHKQLIVHRPRLRQNTTDAPRRLSRTGREKQCLKRKTESPIRAPSARAPSGAVP